MFDNTLIIEAGDYTIGHSQFPLSRPVHTIQLETFRLMKGTVTNQDYAQFVTDAGYRTDAYWSAMGLRWRDSKQVVMPAFWGNSLFDMPAQPVVGISWYEALAYSNWLSSQTTINWRLPNEVEWEVSAQASFAGKIHHAGRGLPRTINSLGEGALSVNGAYNLLGNVWEWCSTRWGRNWQTLDYPYPYPYYFDDDRDDLSGSYARVMRGGSWFDPLQESHPSKRARYLPGSRGSNIGFRLVTSL